MSEVRGRSRLTDRFDPLSRRRPSFRKWSSASLLLALTVFALWPAQGVACDLWERAIPLKVHNSLYDVEHAAGQWVAVGQAGAIFTSTDALSWTWRDSGVDFELFEVAGAGLCRFTRWAGVGRVVATIVLVAGTRLAGRGRRRRREQSSLRCAQGVGIEEGRPARETSSRCRRPSESAHRG